MFGLIHVFATGKGQVLFWALVGLLSMPVSAWSGDRALKTAAKHGIESLDHAKKDRASSVEKHARGDVAMKAVKKAAKKTAKMTKKNAAMTAALIVSDETPKKTAMKKAVAHSNSGRTRQEELKAIAGSGMAKESRAKIKPERLANSAVTMDPFADDNNPRKDPINRAATRMVKVPLTKSESVHLNVMGQMFKLSFKLRNKKTHEDDAALLRYLHFADPRATTPATR